jgi:(E)-4-hydroxy-3-methylbut-2-enyl-diphosphate synthase
MLTALSLSYTRRKTRIVHIGDVPMGGKYPIRVQSMTNTPTLDTQATVNQCIRLIEEGCDYVRITAPGAAEAENLRIIKDKIRKAGFKTPLIADIHFKPEAALIAARLVEKVRINPGNYADKKNFLKRDYTDIEYKSELERISERLFPLLQVCRENGTAIRIGVNHGSLSDRIMNRYGDTVAGMVESAMEFARICNQSGFHELVISMKSSNIRTMIQANRLLAFQLDAEGMEYPLHLGVTEAGDGDDGRIKSAMGIGSLLEDGIGDTIRISLTEDPVNEILPAKDIVRRYKQVPKGIVLNNNTLTATKQVSQVVGLIGGNQRTAVITSCTGIAGLKCHYFSNPEIRPDYLFNSFNIRKIEHPDCVDEIELLHHQKNPDKNPIALLSVEEYQNSCPLQNSVLMVRLEETDCQDERLAPLLNDPAVIFILESRLPASAGGVVHQFRRIIHALRTMKCTRPVVIRRSYAQLHPDLVQLYAAIEFGSILTDGLCDGIWLDADPKGSCKFPARTAFDILQCSGNRITRNDYIACPSCGRTQFDIQSVLKEVRNKTSHLKGLKIAVMGCIVNGPGEMADAHFGYVGAGSGKVNLYKGKELILKQIPEKEAIDALLDLIAQES